MPKPRKPPKELLEQRPALDFQEEVRHPDNGPPTGEPPAKYTKAVHDRIIQELMNGQRPQGACARAGITMATFHEWIRKGKANDPFLYQFAEDVEIAYNTAEARAVDKVLQTIDDDQASAEDAKWWLERARADAYSKAVKSEVEKQQIDFLQQLEMHLEPELFQKVLSIYLGNNPTPQLPEKS